MAIRLAEEYLGKVEPPSEDYPHGAPRNESMPDANDGTPFEEAWLRDYEGFSQALLKEANITPSGEPDTALVSQRLEALKALLLPRSEMPAAAGYLHSTGDGYEAQTAQQLADAVDGLLPLAQLNVGKPIADPAATLSGPLLSGAMLAAGAIVEMGENANGVYVRWESGLQVCLQGYTLVGHTASNPRQLTFPAAFVAGPALTTSMFRHVFDQAHMDSKIMNTLPDLTGFLQCHTGGALTDIRAAYVAIGRWK